MAKRTPRPQSDEPTNASAQETQPTARGSARREGPPTRTPEPERAETAADQVTAGNREPSAEEIRYRAYELYLERGGEHGLDFEDWLKAEQELKNRRPGE